MINNESIRNKFLEMVNNDILLLDDEPYLSHYLEFSKPVNMSDDSSIGAQFETDYINQMFEVLDKYYTKKDMSYLKNYMP